MYRRKRTGTGPSDPARGTASPVSPPDGDASPTPPGAPLSGLLGEMGATMLLRSPGGRTSPAFPHWTHPTRAPSGDRPGAAAAPPAARGGRAAFPPPPGGLEARLRGLGGGRPSRLTGRDDSVGTSELGSLWSERSGRIDVPSFVFHRTHPGTSGRRGGRHRPTSPSASSGGSSGPSTVAYSYASGGPAPRGRGGGGDGNLFGTITSHIFPVSIQVSFPFLRPTGTGKRKRAVCVFARMNFDPDR